MKTIIIAEKPSVASSFSQALGGHRKDGFFENDYTIKQTRIVEKILRNNIKERIINEK